MLHNQNNVKSLRRGLEIKQINKDIKKTLQFFIFIGWLANFEAFQCSLQEIQHGILLTHFGLLACSLCSLLHMWIIKINALPYLLSVLPQDAAVLSVRLSETWIVSPWMSCTLSFPWMCEQDARALDPPVCGERDQSLVQTREEMLGAGYCKPGELCGKTHTGFSGCLFFLLSLAGLLSLLKPQQMGFSALFILQRHDTRWGTQAQSWGKVCSRWQSETLLNMPARYLSRAWQTARTNRDGGKAG